MIAALLPLIARVGVPERFQRALAWMVAIIIAAAIVALLIWAFWRWVGHREDAAVKADRVDVTIEAAQRVINATETADQNQMARDEAAATADKELSHEAAKGDDSAVGVGTRSVLERMRQQQAQGRR